MMGTRTVVGMVVALVIGVAGVARGEDELVRGWREPGGAARPQAWWHWMNGNVSREGITKDLEAMRRVGLGGFQCFNVTDGIPRGPVDYMSAEWLELTGHAIAESARLGLEAGMHNGPGWSMSGGPWITPELSMQELVWTEADVRGGARVEVVLGRPEARRDWYRDVAVIAFPKVGDFRIEKWEWKSNRNVAGRRQVDRFGRDTREAPAGDVIDPADVVVLTGKMGEDGRLTWDAPPAGEWTVVRFGHTTTGRESKVAPPAGNGLECNKLDRVGLKTHWENTVAKVIAKAGAQTGKAFRNVHADSWEVGLQNWTSGMEKLFADRVGYELAPYLPCMTGRVVGSVDATERFLWDYRRLVAGLMAENYFGYMRELCHANGMRLIVEPYNMGGFDYYQVAAIADIPMGEFWIDRPDAWHQWSVKLAASAAHAGGKSVVAAESFTASPPASAWNDYPSYIKTLGDRFFAEGLSQIVFHTNVHQPWADDVLPGMTMGPHGMQMNRNTTWHRHARPWVDHLARTQHVLQQGRAVVDLCYLAPEDPPLVPVLRPEMSPVPPAGYDYDIIHNGFVMQMGVKDGRLVLPSGMSYAVLVLPDTERMRPEVLGKVVELKKAGARVFAPRKIVASPSLVGGAEADRKVRELAAELTVGGDLAGLLPGRDVAAPEGVVWAHRRVGERDVYFVANQQQREVKFDAAFRATGEVEVWRTEDGRIERVPDAAMTADLRTRVPMRLAAADSVFVVFGRKSSAPAVREFAAEKEVALDGAWKVKFDQQEVDLPKLVSWAEHSDENVKYFSGTATYRTTFEAPAGVKAAVLDLGDVRVMAGVKVNGKELGLLWKPPFAVDVSGVLREGTNEVEVSVTNTWANRLIGDERYEPVGEWKANPKAKWPGGIAAIPEWLTKGEPMPETKRRAFATFRHFTKDDPLQPSGLIGPVKVRVGTWKSADGG